MNVTIGQIEFDRVDYDEEVDVLYLHVGDPAVACEFDASPEGHALRFDADDRLVGITMVNPRFLLEEEGRVVITTPRGRLQAGSDELSDAILRSAA